MRVTADGLRALGVCEEDVALFAAEWPDGCEVTAETLARARELGLDVDWWAEEMWGAEYLARRDPLWAKYRAKRTALRAECRGKMAVLREWDNAWMAAPSAEYRAKLDAPWAEYLAKRDALILALAEEGK